jgi:hypothetical protein
MWCAHTDWLVERKKLPMKWQDGVRVVREMINGALTELPDVPEITDMLKGKCKHHLPHINHTGQYHTSASSRASSNGPDPIPVLVRTPGI